MKKKKTLHDIVQEAKNRFPAISPRAAVVAAWIEKNLTLSVNLDGVVGAPFILAPYQIDMLNRAYPGMPGEPRTISRVFFSTGRKQGKTEFLSALSLVHFIGPESQAGAQVINAAGANEKQARITLLGAKGMIERNPRLARKVKYVNAQLTYETPDDIRFVRAVPTNVQGLQGLRISFFTLDEISETADRDLYEALNLAQTNDRTMGWLSSTRSLDPTSLYCQLDDEIEDGQKMSKAYDHWLRLVWSADTSRDKLYTWDQVQRASPGIGYTISEKILRTKLEEAKRSIGARPNFRSRVLNIESGTNASLIDPEKWNEAGDTLISREALWGKMRGQRARIALDIGNSISMTALAVYWPDVKYVSVVNFMARKMVGNFETLLKAPFQDWADAGRLILLDSSDETGYDYKTIADWIVKAYKYFNIQSFRYDGWHFTRVVDELALRGMRKDRPPLEDDLDAFVQGAKSFGTAICEFEDLMLATDAPLLKHDNDPVTNMSVRGCLVQSDPTATKENRKPEKNKNRLPNDAAVAMLMAIANREVNLGENTLTSDEDIEALYGDWDEDDDDEPSDEDDGDYDFPY